MPEVISDAQKNELSVNSYNGYFEENLMFGARPLNKPFQEWNFYRENSNHAYVKGKVSFNERCTNTLIISPYQSNILTDVANAFIFVRDSFIEVSPISDVPNAISKGKRKLSNQKVNYHTPAAVFKRENLTEKDLDKLKRKVGQTYGIEPEKISIINSRKTRNGIYYIRTLDGKEYVLKFRGEEKRRAELLSQITQSTTAYFPLNFRRRDNGDFTLEIEKELWGLEEFVRGAHKKQRNLRYFSLLGNHISLLHNHFLSFLERNERVKKILTPIGSYTSESNLISFYLDLVINNPDGRLLSELERIIQNGLSNQTRTFPMMLIHGDLNHSNLIWQKNSPKIVDSETIKNSIRLNEFESPLLFGRNMAKPIYVKGSMKVIIYSYNQSSERPLSQEEIKALPLLLKYAILRNFIVRKIRRRVKDKSYLGRTISNLRLIEKDSC